MKFDYEDGHRGGALGHFPHRIPFVTIYQPTTISRTTDMKHIWVIALSIMFPSMALAQDSAKPILSTQPTSAEISLLFLRASVGKYDPFSAMAVVTSKGDKVVPFLDQIIRADSLLLGRMSKADSALVVEHLTVPKAELTILARGLRPPDVTALERQLRDQHLGRIRIYALLCVEAIGTRSAYDVLLSYAESATETDTRGLAIRALATTFREDDHLARSVPGKEMLHAFLRNADEKDIVPYLCASIGELARQGLLAWMDLDTGEPQGKSTRLVDAKGLDRGSITDAREQWWLANEKAIVWDSESKMFIRK